MTDIKQRLAQLNPEQRRALLAKLAQSDPKKAAESIRPGRKSADDAPFPLSSAQQRMWFFERLQPDAGAHNLNQMYKLQGPIAVDHLQTALRHVIKRHDALRTGFIEQQGQPYQFIKPAQQVDFELAQIALTDLSDDAQEQALQQTIQQQLHYVFDLEQAPLLTATLIKLKSDESVLITVMHHIISDAWSQGLLFAEIEPIYNQLCSGRQNSDLESSMTAPPLQFSDFVVWQTEADYQNKIRHQLKFWHKTLAGVTGLLDIPTDFPRTQELSLRGAREHIKIEPELLQQLNQFAQQQGITLYMLLLAGFQILLSRHSGQQEIMVGTPVANRGLTELQSVIGLCVNTLALHGDLTDDPSVTEFLSRTRNHCLDAFSHSDVPLEKLVDDLNIERVPGRTPLIQTMFVMQNGDEQLPKLHDVNVSHVEGDMHAARFEMTLSMVAMGNSLQGVFDYNRDLFHPHTVQRLLQQFTVVLNSMVAQPQQKVSQLSIMTPSMQQALLTLGHGGAPVLPEDIQRHDNLYSIVKRQAQKTPEAIAIMTPQLELNYRQLLDEIKIAAQQLQQYPLQHNSHIALLADRSIESLISLLAILATGAAYVPLDPSSPDERLRFILDDADIQLLITPTSMEQQAHRIAAHCPVVVKADAKAHQVSIESINPNPVEPPISKQDQAYIIYTSGSTGTPKGVIINHGNAMNLVQGFLDRHDFNGQRLLMLPPLFFDASVGDIFPVLASGSTLALHPNPTELGASELMQFCQRHQISAIDAPAALWRRWTEGLATLSATPLLPTLKLMMFGGESVPLTQVRRFSKLTENRVELFNHYGPTEASVCAALLHTQNGSEYPMQDLPIGRPLPGVNLYVLDHNKQLLPQGAVGELYIGGIGVAQGYLARPELNEKHFMLDCFDCNHAFNHSNNAASQQPRMYGTGDLVRWNNDGTLQFIGRIDHQVKLRGIRIELGEIESALSSYTGIKAAAVTLSEINPGNKQLVAYYVSDNSSDTEQDQNSHLHKYLSATLPDAMLPSIFQRLDAMPLTNNGKINRNALPKPSLKQVENRARILPKTESQQRMMQIWTELLSQPQLSIDDEFFNVGGDSLQALSLVYKIKKAFHVELPVSAIFSAPTIAGLAKIIDQLKMGKSMERLDLDSKVILPEEIDVTHAQPAKHAGHAPKFILMTGATGFLGAYLLRQLLDSTRAQVLCLIRAKSEQHAMQRVQQNLENYDLWRADDQSRILPIIGDLAAPALGQNQQQFENLAQQVDVIFHNGGQVNFLAPYENLEAANVQGTIEVLKLATTHHIKPVHLVSTLGIYLSEEYLDKRVTESEAPPSAASQQGGYNQSKWVSEQLAIKARERGVPVSIYRPARITGDSRSGVANLDDYFNSWVKGCVQLQMLPDISGDTLDMAPVDYVSAAIVKIALGAGKGMENFHFINPHRLPLEQLYQSLLAAGIAIKKVPYNQWRKALMQATQASESNALSRFASLFPQVEDDTELVAAKEPHFDCNATEGAVSPFAITCPPADRVLFSTYLDYMLEQGFLAVSNQDEVPA